MALRSIWSGNIVFGMTAIPIKVHTALDGDREELHSYHRDCGQRLSQPKVCGNCDRPVQTHEVAKGVDYSYGRTILLSDEDQRRLAAEQDYTLKVDKFVWDEVVDPIYFSTAYYITVDERYGHGDAYGALWHAMKDTHQLALGRIILKTKESFVALRPVDGGFMMHVLHWPELVRNPDWDGVPTPDPSTAAQAIEQVKAMSGPWVPSEAIDRDRARLKKLLQLRMDELDYLG